MLARAAWGIDLTGGALKAVLLERRGRKYHVLEAAHLPYSRAETGAEPPSAHVPGGALEAAREFVADHVLTLGEPAFVGIHGYGSYHGQLTIPALAEDKVQEFLEFELRRLIPQDPEDLICRVGRRKYRRRREETVRYFAHRQAVVHTFLADLERTGLPADGLVAEPLALARFLDLEWAGRGRRLALQIQRTRTDLVFLTEQGPRFRSLPVGVGGLTGFTTGGRMPPREEVDRLAARVSKECRLAADRFLGSGSQWERTLLLGDGASLPTLRHALAQELGQALEELGSTRFLEVSEKIRGGVALDVAQMGSALGLAMAAVRPTGEEFSLVPPPTRRRVARLRGWLGVSLLILAAGLLGLRILAGAELASLRELDVTANMADEWARQDLGLALHGRTSSAGSEKLAIEREVGRLTIIARWPRQVLEAMTDPGVFFRLTGWALNAPDGAVTCDIEVPGGLPGAAEQVRDWAQRTLKVQVETVEDLGTEDRVLRMRVHGILWGSRS